MYVFQVRDNKATFFHKERPTQPAARQTQPAAHVAHKYAPSGTQNARLNQSIRGTLTLDKEDNTHALPSLINLDLGLLREGVRGDDPAFVEVLPDLLHCDVHR